MTTLIANCCINAVFTEHETKTPPYQFNESQRRLLLTHHEAYYE